MKTPPSECSACGSDELSWQVYVTARHSTAPANGAPLLSEGRPEASLGCDGCSETLMTIDGDEIANVLNWRA